MAVDSLSESKGAACVDLTPLPQEPPVERRRPARTRGPAEPNFRRIIEANPFRCRIWGSHDRLSDYVTDESCKSEIDSVARHGQLVPVLGRPVQGDPDADVEIIYGARRLFVAQHLNLPLRVELRNLTDREAIVAMDIENRHRKDLSPYERGMSYARWLRTKHFNSQDDIARALKVSASQVSRLLKLAQLPSVIVSAFASPLDIREGWGLELLQQWQDSKKRPLMAQRARIIGSRCPRAGAEEVYRHLLASPGSARTARLRRHDIVVTGSNGSPLFRVRHHHNSVVFILPTAAVLEVNLERIRQTLSDIIQTEL